MHKWSRESPTLLVGLLQPLPGVKDILAYAPINGLPQDGEAGQSTGIRLCKARVGGDFDIHNSPQGGKFDSNFILFLFKHGKSIR